MGSIDASASETKKEQVFRLALILFQMRKMGLEPTRLYKHKILSLACLPIPALPHMLLCRLFLYRSRRLVYNNRRLSKCQ